MVIVLWFFPDFLYDINRDVTNNILHTNHFKYYIKFEIEFFSYYNEISYLYMLYIFYFTLYSEIPNLKHWSAFSFRKLFENAHLFPLYYFTFNNNSFRMNRETRFVNSKTSKTKLIEKTIVYIRRVLVKMVLFQSLYATFL